MNIGINYVSKYDGSKQLCITIPLALLLDNMYEHDRNELIGYAVASGQLLKLLCSLIATGPVADPPAADVSLDPKTIGDMRQALMPLLSDAHAVELKKARELADKNAHAERVLSDLVHIDSMCYEMQSRESRTRRFEQYAAKFELAKSLYPEYARKA